MDAREAAKAAAKAKAEQERLDRLEAREWKRRRREEAAAQASISPVERAKAKRRQTQQIIVGGSAAALLAVGILLVLGLLSGPRSKMPGLNAVEGTVTRGTTPAVRIYIRLVSGNPDDEASFTINGFSDETGKIEIHTIEAKTGKKSKGAPEGSYQVKVQVPMDADQRGGANYDLPDRFVVKSGDNILPPIDLDKLKKK